MIAVCRDCSVSFNAKPYQWKRRPHRCRPCTNARNREGYAKFKARGGPLAAREQRPFNCRKCGVKIQPTTAEIKDGRYMCGNCRRAYVRSVKARPSVRARLLESRNTPAYKEQQHARNKVRTAIAAGRLARQSCEVCGAEPTHGHHDDYDKPLDVRWLCPSHHSAVEATS